MKILLSMAACQPDRGPGSAVGWNMVQQVARHHQVWVLTHAANRAAIKAATRRSPLPRAQFCYIHGLGGRPAEHAGRSPGANLWHLRAYLRARRLHAEIGFDLAHQVGPAGWTAPGLLALLPVPHVWGPVDGDESTRPGFRTGLDRPGWISAWLGALGRQIATHDPLVRLTARRSAIVLATTKDTAARVRALGAARVELRGGPGARGRSERSARRLAPAARRADPVRQHRRPAGRQRSRARSHRLRQGGPPRRRISGDRRRPAAPAAAEARAARRDRRPGPLFRCYFAGRGGRHAPEVPCPGSCGAAGYRRRGLP